MLSGRFFQFGEYTIQTFHFAHLTMTCWWSLIVIIQQHLQTCHGTEDVEHKASSRSAIYQGLRVMVDFLPNSQQPILSRQMLILLKEVCQSWNYQLRKGFQFNVKRAVPESSYENRHHWRLDHACRESKTHCHNLLSTTLGHHEFAFAWQSVRLFYDNARGKSPWKLPPLSESYGILYLVHLP